MQNYLEYIRKIYKVVFGVRDEDKGTVFSELMTALSLIMDFDETRKLYHAWGMILAERMSRKILPEYRLRYFMQDSCMI